MAQVTCGGDMVEVTWYPGDMVQVTCDTVQVTWCR